MLILDFSQCMQVNSFMKYILGALAIWNGSDNVVFFFCCLFFFYFRKKNGIFLLVSSSPLERLQLERNYPNGQPHFLWHLLIFWSFPTQVLKLLHACLAPHEIPRDYISNCMFCCCCCCWFCFVLICYIFK